MVKFSHIPFQAMVLLVKEHLGQRPLRTALTILGVAIGVSAWLAIRLANEEVFRSFEASVDTVVGDASIQVSQPEHGLDERLLLSIRQHPGVFSAHPVIQMNARTSNKKGQAKDILILGLDVLEFANEDGVDLFQQGQDRTPLSFLLSTESIFLGESLAHKLGVGVGDAVGLHVEESELRVVVRGLVSPTTPNRRHLAQSAIMDIAVAQALFDLQGRLDQINLVLFKKDQTLKVLEDLRESLPSTTTVSRTSQRTQQVDTMMKVFQFNLTMLSTVGLLIGLFLVYNAISFSVVQHRREIGILRAIGMSRSQIRWLFISEASVVGLGGGFLGCGLGLLMAQGLTSLVSQSVSDLYGAVTVGIVPVSSEMILEGCALGLGVAVIGALRPCWEASRTVPIRALAPGDYEDIMTQQSTYWAGMAVVLFVLAGIMSLLQPVRDVPLFGYVAVFFLLLGCTLLGPLLLRSLRCVSMYRSAGKGSVTSSLAAEQLLRNPGRSSVTLSALVIGLAIMVGVSVMIQSFRQTVEWWIDQTMMADIIVAPTLWWKGNESDKQIVSLSRDLIQLTQKIPGVASVDPYREVQAIAGGSPTVLVSRDISLHAEHSQYLFEAGDSTMILDQMIQQKGVIISEVLGGRLGLHPGDSIRLSTAQGMKNFPVLGRFYDYATDGGKVVMDHSVYRENWSDSHASVLAVYLESGTELERVRARIEDVLSVKQSVTTISNGELREEILNIFDRTFRVTYVLELIALCVAVLGIVNTLITAVLERQRELATLRALGASTTQIQQLVFWESGYLASLGAVIGIFGGLTLSLLLIKVINKQSFGWTIQLMIPSMAIMEAVCVAVLSGLLAGVIPARWAASQRIADGLRYE